MKQSIFVGVAIIAFLATTSCSRNPRMAIVYSDSADSSVTNGTAFDRAAIDLGDCHAIVVSSKSKVEFSEKPGKLTVRMEKCLGFFGHPGESASIDEMRTEMGCAYRKSDGKIYIGKFGEFDSGIEGGKTISLTVCVPAGTVVERNDSTELPHASGARTSPLEMHHKENESWCSLDGSSDHWVPLVGEPDRDAFERRESENAKTAR